MRRLMCFGEINEPSSRAFWDDFDEEEEGAPETPKLEWDYSSSTEQSPLSLDLLLLVEGVNVTEFCKQVLLRDTVQLCEIKNKRITLHKVTGKNQIIGLLEENLSDSGEVAALLVPYSELAKQVITITIQPKVEYKSDNLSAVRDEITFLRAVNPGVRGVTELEAPNFIAGAAAGICSYREIKNLPVNSYIAYTDMSDLDTLSSAPILKLLRQIGISCPNKFVPKVKEQSHLYM